MQRKSPDDHAAATASNIGGDHKLSTFQTDYKTFDRVKTIKRGKSVADVWVDPPRVRQMARGGRLSW